MSEITLWHGDCLELMKNIPDRSVDLILTDLPYGTTRNQWDSVIPFDRMWMNINRVIKENGTVALFGAEPFSSMLRCSNLDMYKYDWIWSKGVGSGFLNAKKQPLRSHETISIFYKKQSPYYPVMTKGEKCHSRGKSSKANTHTYNSYGIVETEEDMKYPLSVLSFPRIHPSKQVHPTQKPVELLEYLIKTYTKENEVVLDFTMGSGSTGVACVNTNRDFIGIELDDKYFDIAKKRIEEANTSIFDL